MSNQQISAASLAQAVSNLVSDHIVFVEREAESDIIEVASEAVADLKATSPYDKNSKGRHYSNGWRMKAKAGGSETGKTQVVVHNATKPGLTHLLEHGHGGPVPAAAKPHIEEAFNRAKGRMDARLK